MSKLGAGRCGQSQGVGAEPRVEAEPRVGAEPGGHCCSKSLELLVLLPGAYVQGGEDPRRVYMTANHSSSSPEF